MKKIISELFSDKSTNVYAVVDGASIEGLLLLLEKHHVEKICLYRGKLADDLAAVAPYLIKLTRESSFLKMWLTENIGRHWGLFAVSHAGLKVMRRHFRSILMVKDHKGRQLYFRYYDPRVLRIFLPSCTMHEIDLFFGEVDSFYTEGDDPEFINIFRKGQATESDGLLVSGIKVKTD